jgi:hypothetical protein
MCWFYTQIRDKSTIGFSALGPVLDNRQKKSFAGYNPKIASIP